MGLHIPDLKIATIVEGPPVPHADDNRIGPCRVQQQRDTPYQINFVSPKIYFAELILRTIIFCIYCWYFFTISTNAQLAMQKYRAMISTYELHSVLCIPLVL